MLSLGVPRRSGPREQVHPGFWTSRAGSGLSLPAFCTPGQVGSRDPWAWGLTQTLRLAGEGLVAWPSQPPCTCFLCQGNPQGIPRLISCHPWSFCSNSPPQSSFCSNSPPQSGSQSSPAPGFCPGGKSHPTEVGVGRQEGPERHSWGFWGIPEVCIYQSGFWSLTCSHHS